MFVIRNKTVFFILSAILVLASIGSIAVWGLTPSIDFAGGSILEVSYPGEAPSLEDVTTAFEAADMANASVRTAGAQGFLVRTPFLDDANRDVVLNALSVNGAYELVEERFSSVGPSIGRELRTKAYIAIALVILMIILYVAFVFRHVSKPVSSWKYGLVAIIALAHDIIIPTGVFAVLGYTLGLEVDVLFVMALLAILGFSVNDTIVVFDRIRENLRNKKELKGKKETFEETVGKSLTQSYARSINTSLTTLVVLLALYFIGGETIHNFVLTLIVGVIAGTYSSIFLASPLLTVLASDKKRQS